MVDDSIERLEGQLIFAGAAIALLLAYAGANSGDEVGNQLLERLKEFELPPEAGNNRALGAKIFRDHMITTLETIL